MVGIFGYIHIPEIYNENLRFVYYKAWQLAPLKECNVIIQAKTMLKKKIHVCTSLFVSQAFPGGVSVAS